jgi:hypothetical protein
MLMGLNYAKKQLPEPLAQERLSLALDEADRLQQLLTEILLYAKPQILKLTKIHPGQFFQDLLVQIRELPEASDRIITLQIDPCLTTDPRNIEILGDVNKLKQVFINLFRNACEAIAPGEPVTCNLTKGPRLGSLDSSLDTKLDTKLDTNPAWLHIRIHNGGDPIPAELLPKLTQPFCSTKASGTGLGLAIVKRIIMAHDGDLLIQSEAPTGTTATVALAIANPAA